MKKIAVLVMPLLFLTGCLSYGTGSDTTTTTTQPGTEKIEEKPFTNPVTTTNMSGNRTAVIQTNMGTMELELFEERAPITTGNFIDLAEKGYFDGIIFHRVIDGFMIQGGDPDGTSRGGPGYSIDDEFHPDLKHDSAGIMSMANSGPNSGGSQFFITLVPTSNLDGRHAVFGKVTKGMDVLTKIGSTETDAGDRPLKDVVMEKVTIVSQ